MLVAWSEFAEHELDELEARGRRMELVAERIAKMTRSLAAFPDLGHPVPKYEAKGLRQFLVDGVRVVYYRTDDLCEILRVLRPGEDFEFED
jgi:plasmid stabilization system protein ParE